MRSIAVAQHLLHKSFCFFFYQNKQPQFDCVRKIFPWLSLFPSNRFDGHFRFPIFVLRQYCFAMNSANWFSIFWQTISIKIDFHFHYWHSIGDWYLVRVYLSFRVFSFYFLSSQAKTIEWTKLRLHIELARKSKSGCKLCTFYGIECVYNKRNDDDTQQPNPNR